MTELRRDHLLYMLQTTQRKLKGVTMVHLNSLRKTKVALTVYVGPEVKRGMKIAATNEGMTTSKLVEQLLLDYLLVRPAEEK